MMRVGRLIYRGRVLLVALSLFAVAAGIVLVAWSAHAMAARPSFLVICHPDSITTTVERSFLRDVFLKKVSSWPTGQRVYPIDLAPNSPTRRLFSETVLNRPVEAVRSYWQQHIFSGRDLPPPEVDSESEVIRYVHEHAGAVGYLSADSSAAGVKVLTVR